MGDKLTFRSEDRLVGYLKVKLIRIFHGEKPPVQNFSDSTLGY